MPVSNLWKSSGACYETAMKSFRFSDAREWAAAALMAAALFSAARGAEKILPDTQALAEVAAGKCREVRAAWWGFDPADATKARMALLRILNHRPAGPATEAAASVLQRLCHVDVDLQNAVASQVGGGGP